MWTVIQCVLMQALTCRKVTQGRTLLGSWGYVIGHGFIGGGCLGWNRFRVFLSQVLLVH